MLEKLCLTLQNMESQCSGLGLCLTMGTGPDTLSWAGMCDAIRRNVTIRCCRHEQLYGLLNRLQCVRRQGQAHLKGPMGMPKPMRMALSIV